MSKTYDIPADIRAYLDQGAAGLRDKMRAETTEDLVAMMQGIWDAYAPLREIAKLPGILGKTALPQAVACQFALVAMMDEIYRREDTQ